MSGDKESITLEINSDAKEMLSSIVDKYNLPDTSKAIRCLLDYTAEVGDWDTIFKKIRCRRC